MSSTTLTRISPFSCITLGFVLFALMVMSTGGDLSQAQSGKNARPDEPGAANNYGFSQATPPGDWVVRTDFDIFHSDDSSMPVVLVGIRSYAGKGAWRKQLMIEGITLKNRTSKLIQAVRLGWIIMSEHDRNGRKNREAALVEGYTELLKLESSSQRIRKLNSLRIDFVNLAKPLLRNGNLNGSFYLRVRLSEVVFDDGTVWRESQPIALRRMRSHARSRSATSQIVCENRQCGPLDENFQRWCEPDPVPGFICRRENCNPNDLRFCSCNLYRCDNCKDQDGDGWFDCEGDCLDTANNVNAFNTHPGADEICGDGIDNDCDPSTFDNGADCIPPTPSPSPTPPPTPIDFCLIREAECIAAGLPFNSATCDCLYDPVNCGGNGGQCTPVLIDVAGNGFDLTDAAGGVNFDMGGDGSPERIAWTAARSDDAWLVVDRNGDGVVNNGTELFGNATPQSEPPSGVHPNGFNALAEFDKPQNGGNGDHQITNRDSVFSSLRLWQDINHNGVSELNELHRLATVGLTMIDLDYRESRRRDQHGNWFRYRAKVYGANRDGLGRWAWDVFLTASP